MNMHKEYSIIHTTEEGEVIISSVEYSWDDALYAKAIMKNLHGKECIIGVAFVNDAESGRCSGYLKLIK